MKKIATEKDENSREEEIHICNFGTARQRALFELATSLRCVSRNWSMMRCLRVAFLIPFWNKKKEGGKKKKKAKRCWARESAWLYTLAPRVYNYSQNLFPTGRWKFVTKNLLGKKTKQNKTMERKYSGCKKYWHTLQNTDYIS